MRDLLLKIHLWLGLGACLFLLLLGISGASIAFEDELNRAFNPGMLTVQAAGQRLSWDAIRRRVEQQVPGWKIVRFYFPQSPDQSLYLRLRAPAGKKTRQVYANQYTGAVLGDAAAGNRITLFMHDLHVNLASGAWGSHVVVMGTAILLVLSISGLALWWPRKVFAFSSRSPRPRLNNDLHRSLGFWSSAAMLMFSVTGLLLHYQSGGKLLQIMNENSTAVNTAGAGTSIDALVANAEKAAPGAAVIRLMLPEKKGDAILVQARYPEDHTPAGRTYMNLDPMTGAVLTITSSRSSPWWLRALVIDVRELHTGTILGTPTRVLALLLSLCLIMLTFTGPLIWINRWRATRRGQRMLRKGLVANRPAQSAAD